MAAHTHCRICRTPLPAPFLDLGAMPLANRFLSSPSEFGAEPSYPLATTACRTCGLVQLTYVVPAEELYRQYIYVSSTSDAVSVHAQQLATTLPSRFGWHAGDRIIEIASNDGTALKPFRAAGLQVLGVEPARNIATLAQTDGVPTVPEFFTEALALELSRTHGAAVGILARHVFAHVDDVHDFLRGAKRLLAEDGVLIIEVPYLLDLVDGLEFDTIYHEHLSYFALTPIVRACQMSGLALVDVERIELHGGSLLLYIRHERNAQVSDRLRRLSEREHAVTSNGWLGDFGARVGRWKEQFQALIAELKDSGAVIVGYGAAAKGNTLLNYCPSVARTLRFILDRSPHKERQYTPGTHVRVEAVDRWKESGATHMLILAWNFSDEIMRQMRPFADAGGRFIVPIPTPRIV